MIATTALGHAPRDRYVTLDARPEDVIYVTKGIGLEGTGILAEDHRSVLEGLVGPEVLERATRF